MNKRKDWGDWIDESERCLLEDAFHNDLEVPMGKLDKLTFRTKRPQELEKLDKLERLQLIRLEREPSGKEFYRVPLCALLLIKNHSAIQIVKKVHDVYEYLKDKGDASLFVLKRIAGPGLGVKVPGLDLRILLERQME